ncbi:hypothetical protein [Nonomuraea sp. NPDC049504]
MAATAGVALAAIGIWRRWTAPTRYAEWEPAWERADERWRHPHRP